MKRLTYKLPNFWQTHNFFCCCSNFLFGKPKQTFKECVWVVESMNKPVDGVIMLKISCCLFTSQVWKKRYEIELDREWEIDNQNRILLWNWIHATHLISVDIWINDWCLSNTRVQLMTSIIGSPITTDRRRRFIASKRITLP